MSAPKASTTYRKREGTLAVSHNRQSIAWTPVKPPGAPAEVTIEIPQITNLQQTPAANPKVALKIFVQTPGETEPTAHVFFFTSTSAAKAEQEAVTEALRGSLAAHKANTGPHATSELPDVTTESGQSAAMAIAAALAPGTRDAESWYDDARLLSNIQLQQSLLRSDMELSQRFQQSVRNKPESISISQFQAQFWSHRLHLLRAHAVEKNQSQGAYNVLSEIKPRTVDGSLKLNLSKEQIQLIFSQHPFVKRVYNENVPKLSEMEFWSRFFVSRLFKKLKGEKITDADSVDAVLDKYLRDDYDATLNTAKHVGESRVTKFIDLEGNEQNHSQRRGNQADETMRPSAYDSRKAPILRVLNNMSEKMIAQVTPNDRQGQAHRPIGMDEEAYNEMVLRDLQAEDVDNRVTLNIRDQREYGGTQISDEAATYSKENSYKMLDFIKSSIDPQPNILERATESKGNGAAIAAAQKELIALVREASTSAEAMQTGLSTSIIETLQLTHGTTTEFLHHYYTALYTSSSTSASSKRAAELSGLAGALENSLERINAVAETAQKEKNAAVQATKKQAKEYEAKTGKKRKIDYNLIGGKGADGVKVVMAPTIKAVEVALEKWRALNEGGMP